MSGRFRSEWQRSAGIFLVAYGAAAAIVIPAAHTMNDDADCSALAVFDSPEAVDAWRAVNDNVMGGRSSGGPQYRDGELVFSGSINTDGGGFSSIRAPLASGALAGVDGLKLTIRSDGRGYRLTLRSDVQYRGVDVAYRAEIAVARPGEWSDSVVLFDDLEPSVRGRSVPAPAFDPAKAASIGIIISDGEDGPFELAVRSIHTCTF